MNLPWTQEVVVDEDLQICLRFVVDDDVTDDTAVYTVPCTVFSDMCLQALRTSIELEAWQRVGDTLAPELGDDIVRATLVRVAQQTVDRLSVARQHNGDG